MLERITGLPASFWNRREADYREGLLRAKPRVVNAEDEKWLKSLPLAELKKRDELPSLTDRGRLLDAAPDGDAISTKAGSASPPDGRNGAGRRCRQE